MIDDSKARANTMVDIITRVSVGLTLAAVIWVASSVSGQGAELAVVKERVSTIALRLEGYDSLNARIARVEANRFTSVDGLEIWKELSCLKEQVIAMSARLKAVEEALTDLRK